MKLKVLKIVKHRSKRFRNYRWWEGIKEFDVIEINDEMIRGNLVDADAIPEVLYNENLISKPWQ